MDGPEPKRMGWWVVVLGVVLAAVLLLFLPGAAGAAAPGPVDASKVWDAVVRFFQDTRLFIVLGLIGVDLVMGVALAIKQGAFDLRQLGRFYQTMVAPYVIGYLALYVAFALVPGGLEGILGAGLANTAFGFIVLNLVGSIWANLKGLGFKQPESQSVEGT